MKPNDYLEEKIGFVTIKAILNIIDETLKKHNIIGGYSVNDTKSGCECIFIRGRKIVVAHCIAGEKLRSEMIYGTEEIGEAVQDFVYRVVASSQIRKKIEYDIEDSINWAIKMNRPIKCTVVEE